MIIEEEQKVEIVEDSTKQKNKNLSKYLIIQKKLLNTGLWLFVFF